MKEFIVFLVLLAGAIAANSYGILPIDFATFFVFILVLGFLIYRDRKNVDFDKIVFIRRTKRGRNFIDHTAKRHMKFWHALGTIGIAVCTVVLVLGSFYLISMSYTVVTEKQGGLRLLLPGPVSAPTNLPGVFVMPWWIWIIGVAVVIVPHEFMHGIMCRIDKVRIKAVGWILLLIIPGAFVEPDEKQLQKAKRGTKMRVYAAGSFANIITAMIVLGIMFVYFSMSFTPAGAYIGVRNGTPAFDANLSGSITEIGGMPVRSYQDIHDILDKYKPGDTIQVTTMANIITIPSFHAGWDFFSPRTAVIVNSTDVKTYSLTLTTSETGRPFMGVFYDSRYAPSSYSFNNQYIAAYMLLFWIYVFSFGIGIFNILPMKPLDGGLLLEEIMGKKRKRIVTVVSVIMLLVILFNLIGPAVLR
ncbi:MAG: site-2 protease family protein [Candidatus Aenigmarchaeota archaeon]|nr:site-2 protease family protein [Candidatus Aenigmarchaeota archaeon]